MPRTVVIEWTNVPPAELRGNSSLSRKAQYPWKKALREAGYWAAVESIGTDYGPPIEHADVAIHYWNPVPIDYVNFARGIKAFEDALLSPKSDDWRYDIMRANVLLDDSPRVVREFSMRWHKGDPRTVITITEVTE